MGIFDLSGNTVVVTGGSGYLGAEISKGLLLAGATVFITGTNEKKLAETTKELSKESSTTCHYTKMDIGCLNSIKTSFERIYSQTHSIDILINNAFFGSAKPLEDMSDEDWEKGINGTINGVFRCTKEVLPYMVQKENGSIINVSSMYGVVSPDPSIYTHPELRNPANYGAGKAAIIQFTRYIACHYGNRGIRANSISPGPFPNQFIQDEYSTFLKNLQNKVPLGRIGNAEDLIGITTLLASSASSYITGQNICVDGGWTAW